MTKEEFMKGWLILTAQPWGKSYRDASPESKIQFGLYYKRVDKANPHVWMAVCEEAATGDHWPNLSELRQALVNNGGYVVVDRTALPHHLRWEESPEPLAACIAYSKDNDLSLKDAALQVLPIWLRDNPHHMDYSAAYEFLQKAKANFGLKGTAGNVRVAS